MKSPILYALLVVLSMFALGCQNSVKPRGHNSNNNNSTGPVELLHCVKIDGALLRGRMETDHNNLSYTYVQFTHTPTEFSEDGATIGFFSGLDVESISTQSAAFVIYHLNLGLLLGSSPTGGLLDQDLLDAIASQNFLPQLSLEDIRLQVNVGPNTRVLRTALRDGVANLEQNMALIPAIDANPNSYASNHPQSLFNIHPLYSYRDQSWTNVQFRDWGNHLCTL